MLKQIKLEKETVMFLESISDTVVVNTKNHKDVAIHKVNSILFVKTIDPEVFIVMSELELAKYVLDTFIPAAKEETSKDEPGDKDNSEDVVEVQDNNEDESEDKTTRS